MDKKAASEEQRKSELDAWSRWIQDRNPNDFKYLLDSYRPLMYSHGKRYLQTSQLPRAAIEADLIQNFHRALETYDPNKGAQMNTHVWNHLQHTGRFLRTHQNIGKIPEPRANMIGRFQARETIMSENLGREPSTAEIADDLKIPMKEIEILRKELRRDIMVDEATAGLALTAQKVPKALERVQFLHTDLNPEQQLVLEHTYGMYGRPEAANNDDIAMKMGMTPQRIRSIKRQIAQKYKKVYG